MGMTAPEEEAWIRAAKEGDLEAFNHLVLLYQSQVYALAYRLVGDHEAASDVAQETFLAAFRHIRRFRGTTLRSWLLRIAANQAYDLLRRRKVRAGVSLDVLQGHPDMVELRRGGVEGDPVAYSEQRELQEEIQRALETLPPGQRAVIVLCDLEGLPYREAAHILGISQGTLKSRLSRGRERMRAYFFERRELLPSSIRFILGRFLERTGQNQEGARPLPDRPSED